MRSPRYNNNNNKRSQRVPPVKVADQALHDELIVVEALGHEIGQLVLVGDGVHALAGVAVRHLDDAVTTKALDPQRNLGLAHVANGLGRKDLEMRIGNLGIVQLVRLVGQELVASSVARENESMSR